MADNFPDALKAELQAAIVRALERENIAVAAGETAIISHPVLGEAEIALG